MYLRLDSRNQSWNDLSKVSNSTNIDFTNNLDTYTIKASLAKSDDWKVRPTKGILIHLPASFTFVPKKKVKINKAIPT